MRFFFFSSEEWVEESLVAQASYRNTSFKNTGSFSAEHPQTGGAALLGQLLPHNPAEAQLHRLQLGKLIAWFLS